MAKDFEEPSTGKKIYRDQFITLGDLEQFKTDLLNELVGTFSSSHNG